MPVAMIVTIVRFMVYLYWVAFRNHWRTTTGLSLISQADVRDNVR